MNYLTVEQIISKTRDKAVTREEAMGLNKMLHQLTYNNRLETMQSPSSIRARLQTIRESIKSKEKRDAAMRKTKIRADEKVVELLDILRTMSCRGGFHIDIVNYWKVYYKNPKRVQSSEVYGILKDYLSWMSLEVEKRTKEYDERHKPKPNPSKNYSDSQLESHYMSCRYETCKKCEEWKERHNERLMDDMI